MSSNEAKFELPIHEVQGKRDISSFPLSLRISIKKIAGCLLLGILVYCLTSSGNGQISRTNPVSYSHEKLFESFGDPDDPHNPDSLCPLVEKVDPSKFIYNNDTVSSILNDPNFKNKSIEKLLGAVRIPTEVYDDMANPNASDSLKDLYKIEPLWKNFETLHEYLEKTFPLVFKHLKVEKVNKFALIITWHGTSDKMPILLTAHQDVVPVQKETIDQWIYPPFEGGFDGEYLYGRGVHDCKDLLIGLLETVELLLEEDEFKPERTIILGFGYDEETAGTGADEISKVLLSRYGPDSLFQLIDEGDEGYTTAEGTKFILPATAEKGHLDSIIELYTPGGHSSVPPDHTAIGILANLIEKIEDVQYKSIITNANPVLHQLQCIAEHSEAVDKDLKSSILKANVDQKANQYVVDYLRNDSDTKYLITTSQAVDIISGGAKSNALPEHAQVLVNHRIAIEESVASTSEKVFKQVKEIADRFDLGVVFDGKTYVEPTSNGYLNYSLRGSLEPAPVTPTNGDLWNLFGGSLRYLYEDLMYPHENETYVFAPFISTGNTDTKSYWDLTRHIYRYQPGIPTKNGNIHSVNERILFKSHQSVIAFYYYYLQIVDKADDVPF
ncbi:uncharacterized protein PRCAT00000551001 [Priceomyces carsonii]|uniref:uncharacterized protein n=1 Tax=Priceomyces carsonii TaxID=28549 RepID=UPI002ED99230|nr:unnamed protein product [Priceomyces carsonii]